jgi:hypothetical protein
LVVFLMMVRVNVHVGGHGSVVVLAIFEEAELPAEL